MSRRHPLSCKVCGARQPFVTISASGLCPDHGRMRLASNLYALKTRSGPEYEKWRRALLARLGLVVLDAHAESE